MNISIIISTPKKKFNTFLLDEYKKDYKNFIEEYQLESPKKKYKKIKQRQKYLNKIVKRKKGKKHNDFLNSNEKKKYYKNINKKLSFLCNKRGRPKKEYSINSETSVSSISNNLYFIKIYRK